MKKIIIIAAILALVGSVAVGVTMKNEQVNNIAPETSVEAPESTLDAKTLEGTTKPVEAVTEPVKKDEPVKEKPTKPTEPELTAERKATLERRASLNAKVESGERLTREDLKEQDKFRAEATEAWDGNTEIGDTGFQF